MTGSLALDVVIGLVFIYLIYSLFATVLCEMLAYQLGMRARNLQQAIRRMLEDSPETSEKKFPAFFKHVWNEISNMVTLKEGPSTCVFYHLPVIKYLGHSTYHSKPSYITSQNFSKAMMEIFRRYGGDEEKPDLEKIQNVLKGKLEYPGVLKSIKDIINTQTKIDPAKLDYKIDYKKIKEDIQEVLTKQQAEDTDPLDLAHKKLLVRIKKIMTTKKSEKAIVYKIDELLNLFGHETRSHLQSLLKDSNNDLQKFRQQLEQWFDDTMARASGWYKQRVQVMLLLVGFMLSISFNANTVAIVKNLSVDKDTRDKMVQMASDYAKDPTHILPIGLVKYSKGDSLRVDSLRKATLDSLDKVRVKLQKDVNDANSILGLGWNLPESLSLVDISKKDSLSKLIKKRTDICFEEIKLKVKNTAGKDSISIDKCIVYPSHLTKSLFYCLPEDSVSKDNGRWYRVNAKDLAVSKIKMENNWRGYTKYIWHTLIDSFWGYLITAIAISLGAPFWFDMLSKLMQIRGAIKTPSSAETADSGTSGNK